MNSGDYHNEYAMSGEEFHSFRRRRSPGVVAFWTSLFVSITTVLLLHFIALPAFKASQKKISVPQLAGLNTKQATQILTSIGLKLERMARQVDKKPAGTILSHVPLPGRRVKEKTTVRVIISLGPDQKTQPTPRTPQATAQTNNTNQETSNNPNTTGTKTAQPAPVRPAVAGRPQTATGTVRMPRLTSMSLSRAKRVLRRMGLRLRHISFGADEDKSPHWVLKQTPRAYKQIPKGSPVDLTINRDDF